MFHITALHEITFLAPHRVEFTPQTTKHASLPQESDEDDEEDPILHHVGMIANDLLPGDEVSRLTIGGLHSDAMTQITDQLMGMDGWSAMVCYPYYNKDEWEHMKCIVMIIEQDSAGVKPIRLWWTPSEMEGQTEEPTKKFKRK